MYYIGSLTLGFGAWAIAALGIWKRRPVTVFASFGLTCAALLLQFFEIKRRVYLGDWSAVIDTISGVIFGAEVLIGITLLLNLTALLRWRKAG